MSRSNPYSLFTASPASSPAPVSSATFAPPTPSPSSISNANSPSAYDPFFDLGRLLVRLEQNLLRADTDRWRRLVSDGFQRQQARFDVAAARKLLTRVEQSTLQVKQVTRRQEMQTELNRRRAVIEQLQERLDDLDEEAHSVFAMRAGGGGDDGSDDDDDDEAEDDEELAYIQTPSKTTQIAGQSALPRSVPSSRATAETAEPTQTSNTTTTASYTPTASLVPSLSSGTPADKSKRKKAGRVRIETPADAGSDSPTTTRMVTRSRKARESRGSREAKEGKDGRPAKDTARTSSAQVAPGSPQLFDKSTEGDGVVAEETILDHHRREQEELSGDILRLAHALKEKSMATARMLEDDKDVVDRVGDGMNTTTDSLTAASKSMALLSRMTEGKGWWGRMMLMAMVYGLMLLLVLLFLFLPKLRL